MSNAELRTELERLIRRFSKAGTPREDIADELSEAAERVKPGHRVDCARKELNVRDAQDIITLKLEIDATEAVATLDALAAQVANWPQRQPSV